MFDEHTRMDYSVKLLQATAKGQTGNIVNYLKRGANINTRNQDGETPLIKAAQRRNYVAQKLILANGGNPKIKDKEGMTALHYVASNGDVECIKLLLAFQAPIDFLDKNGYTPLHYSANRMHYDASDLLVFCGADAFHEGQDGKTPMAACTDYSIKDVLEDSKLITHGIRNNDIHIQHMELFANKRYVFNRLDLAITTPASFGNNSLSFLCRRVRPEYSQALLRPANKELLLSDTFEYRLSGTRINGEVLLEIPIYDQPDPFEEVYMKTDTNPLVNKNNKLTDIRRVGNQHKWICRARVDITKMNSLVLVTKLKVEAFPIGKEAAMFTSTVDNFIQLQIQEESFQSSGHITLKVVPEPYYSSEEFNTIRCIGHFYEVGHSNGEQPSKDVQMTVPLPHDYDGEGDLVILSSNRDPDNEDMDSEEYMSLTEDDWEIVVKNPQTRKGRITFNTPHFCTKVVLETNKNADDVEVRRQAAGLSIRAVQKQCNVVFFSMLKPVGDGYFDTVVECTVDRRLKQRMASWAEKNYDDQKPSMTESFAALPGLEYRLEIKRNAVKASGMKDTFLQFHPHRKNTQEFKVTIRNVEEPKIGLININKKDTDGEQEEKEEELAGIKIYLKGPDVEPDPEDDSGFKGFTNDHLLRYLSKCLGDEWIKIAVLLGLSYKTVEKWQSKRKLQPSQQKFKVLLQWRDRSRHREHYGVPDLMAALRKANRSDLVGYIKTQLEIWLEENTENRDRFYEWLDAHLNSPDMDESEEHPKPMSDLFFISLMERLSGDNLLELGPRMEVSKPEMDDILNDPRMSSQQYNVRLLKILITGRDKQANHVDAFRLLVDSVSSMDLTDAKQWILDTAKSWVSQNNDSPGDSKADSFVHLLAECIKEVDDTYHSPMDQEEKTDSDPEKQVREKEEIDKTTE